MGIYSFNRKVKTTKTQHELKIIITGIIIMMAGKKKDFTTTKNNKKGEMYAAA